MINGDAPLSMGQYAVGYFLKDFFISSDTKALELWKSGFHLFRLTVLSLYKTQNFGPVHRSLSIAQTWATS